MLIFNNYVSSFTSDYSKNVTFEKIIGGEKKSDYHVLKSENGDSCKIELKWNNIFFSPEMSIVIDEKVDGALVYVRMDSSKGKKAFSVCVTLSFLLLLISFIVLTFWGKIHFAVPILTFFGGIVFFRYFEKFWAKKGCIKALKKIGSVVDYTPPYVTVIKIAKA